MEKPKKAKPKENPSLTDAERHARFVQMAHEVGASEVEADFDRAISIVLKPSSPVDPD